MKDQHWRVEIENNQYCVLFCFLSEFRGWGGWGVYFNMEQLGWNVHMVLYDNDEKERQRALYQLKCFSVRYRLWISFSGHCWNKLKHIRDLLAWSNSWTAISASFSFFKVVLKMNFKKIFIFRGIVKLFFSLIRNWFPVSPEYLKKQSDNVLSSCYIFISNIFSVHTFIFIVCALCHIALLVWKERET
jgi:hypothetical protein